MKYPVPVGQQGAISCLILLAGGSSGSAVLTAAQNAVAAVGGRGVVVAQNIVAAKMLAGKASRLLHNITSQIIYSIFE